MPTRPWRIPFPPTRLNNTSESPLSPAPPLSPPPTSPRSSTNTQLTPPPRLHLRNIIPSPPLPKEHLKTAPLVPYPWIWRCHLCCSIYRLGVTRRCLEDGHLFCSLPSPPPSPTASAEEFFSSLSADEGKSGIEIIAELQSQKAKKRRSSRRGRKGRGCRSEFDYAGWSKYNIWRRELRVLKHDERMKLLTRDWKRGEKGGISIRRWKGGRDCWRDCDFPSECHNERKAEREWEKQMREMREWEERWARENALDDDEEEDNNEDDHGRPESALGIGEEDEDMFVDCIEVIKEQKIPAELGPDNGDMVAGVENLGPLGTDCDGLGEQIVQAEYCTKRRKSYDAAMGIDSPLSSPLKTCSFRFEDQSMGCSVWSSEGPCSCAGQGEDEGHLTDKDDDVKMKEVSMANNLISRRAEKDVTETFKVGDEDEDVFEDVI
ncbi:hypothetical protein BDZ45DRAFT_799912 [Acephala macrosclerotiorum]|nr:hypothetical protein BDZ45DRAFT_799912 [Acephala macrosclerotiorum]